MELDKYFQKSELIPAIVQEASTGEVLMLAYMNKESLQKTLETGQTWFYSRSRQELWHKGATSGHTQTITAIYGDCDDDTLLIQVEQIGPACHTGARAAFLSPSSLRGQRNRCVSREMSGSRAASPKMKKYFFITLPLLLFHQR